MSPWTMVDSVNLNLAWIGDQSSDAIALVGDAGGEVPLAVEGVERLLQPELDRRARHQDFETEVFRRIKCDALPRSCTSTTARRTRTSRPAPDLEAVALEEVASLDALALAVRRVALQAGEGVQASLGLLVVGGGRLFGRAPRRRWIAASSRRGRLVRLARRLLRLLSRSRPRPPPRRRVRRTDCRAAYRPRARRAPWRHS